MDSSLSRHWNYLDIMETTLNGINVHLRGVALAPEGSGEDGSGEREERTDNGRP